MKRKLFTLLFTFLTISSVLHAQINEKRTGVIQIGYGYPSAMTMLGSALKFSYSVSGDVTASSSFSYKGFGPVHVRFEYMVSPMVGIGVSANYQTGSFLFENNYMDADDNYVQTSSTFKITSVNALGRVNFHFLKNSKMVDLYYGLGVGYSSNKVDLKFDVKSNFIDNTDKLYTEAFENFLNDAFKLIPVSVESVFGMRWAFSNNVGMYSEVGWCKALAQVGFYAKLSRSENFVQRSPF